VVCALRLAGPGGFVGPGKPFRREFMNRRHAVAGVVVLLFGGCRDGTKEITAPVDVDPARTVLPENVVLAAGLLDDALIREMLDGSGVGAAYLEGAVQDVTDIGEPRHGRAFSDALALTRHLVSEVDGGESSDPDAAIYRAALELILDDAALLLEHPPSTGDGLPEAVGPERVNSREIGGRVR
jgi:hypothetical protein